MKTKTGFHLLKDGPNCALVMGASSGIGRSISLTLADSGVRVFAVARREALLRTLMEELPGSGHSFLAVDLSVPGAVQNALRPALRAFSEVVPIVVNNSGGPAGGPLIEASSSALLQAFQQHVVVAHELLQDLIPGMRSLGAGRVVNVISTSVKTPLANLGVSNTIRAAMASWAKTLANELGPYGVTVNNVLPGYTLTERLLELQSQAAQKRGVPIGDIAKQWLSTVPLGRWLDPKEVAEAVAFLTSAQAAAISGINLPVDGGRTPCL